MASSRSQVRCCWSRPSSVRWPPRTWKVPAYVSVARTSAVGWAQPRYARRSAKRVPVEGVAHRPGAGGGPPAAADGEQVVGPVLAPVQVAGHGADLLGEAGELGVDQPGGGLVPPAVGLLAGRGGARAHEVLEPAPEVVEAGRHQRQPVLEALGLRGRVGHLLLGRRPLPGALAALVGPLAGRTPPPAPRRRRRRCRAPRGAAGPGRACTGTCGSGTSSGTPGRPGRRSPGTASCRSPGTCPRPGSRCCPCRTRPPGSSACGQPTPTSRPARA